MAELPAQITQTGVQVDVDAPKGQDMAKVMEEMRAKYERIALKNQEELKAWHETQVDQQAIRTKCGLNVSTGPMSSNHLRAQSNCRVLVLSWFPV